MEIMKAIVDFLDDNFLTLFFGIFTIVYAFTAILVMKKNQSRKEERKKEFDDILMNGLVDETIENYEDLINVYEGVTNRSADDLIYRHGLNKWLRQFFAKLIGKKINTNLSKEEIISIKKKLLDFITTNEKLSPFSELPDTERNILKDLNSYLNAGDKESSERKIKELSSIIQTRYEEQKKIEKQNKWSVPIAIIGVGLTIVFGLISFFKM